MFDLFLPFVDRYFFIQRNFFEEWICFRLLNVGKHAKLSNLALNRMRENWTPEAVPKCSGSRRYLHNPTDHFTAVV